MSRVATGAWAGRDPAGTGGLRGRLARLEDENAALREEQQRLESERARLRGENERLRAERERLREVNERLRGEVEALRRAARRQAAPFSRNDPVLTPKRAGRKPGAAYGRRAHRRPPERVDQVVAVGLPACCPGCGGELVLERVAVQHVKDLPATLPLVTRYQIQIGRCRSCGRRVQPRHPGQTSDALGAAGTQVGPRAVALASWLSKGLGVPAGKIARLFGQLGLRITPGGVVQALARAGRACQPTHQALVQGVRASPVVTPDETGWRVGGIRAWLWTFVGEEVTVYRIAHGRGYQDAAAVLGEGYAGVIERDGWAPYRRFVYATHQTCLAHLLRRCRELVSDAVAGQAKTPHAVRRILEHALALREARDAGTLDAGQLAAEVAGLEAAVDRLVAGATRHPPNRRLLDHLAREREHLFTFLVHDGVQATNWRAEHAIRPAVVSRKAWGGNRTWAGAATWQALTSVLRTASQQGRDPIELLAGLLRAPAPIVADLAIPDAEQHPTRPCTEPRSQDIKLGRASLRRHQAALIGEDHRLHTVAQAQLGEHVADVGLGGGLGDDQPVGDLGVGAAPGQQPQAFDLTEG
jgi:transposase